MIKYIRQIKHKITRRVAKEKSRRYHSYEWVMKQVYKSDHSLQQFDTNIPVKYAIAQESELRNQVLLNQYENPKNSMEHPYISRNPFYYAPLMAVVIFTTNQKEKIEYLVPGKTTAADISYAFPPATKHYIPIFGLYPGQKNYVTLQCLDKDGKVTKKTQIVIETEPLPDILKDSITVDIPNRRDKEALYMISGGLDILPCIFDCNGDIRYYVKRNPKGYGLFPLSRQRFIYMEKKISTPTFTNPNCVQFHEMDLLGRMYGSYFCENGCHHDGGEMIPGGNLLMASSSHEGQTEDQIVEINRETGEVMDLLRMMDLLGDTYFDRPDWAHINSVQYKNGYVYISLRNVHSALKVDWNTKQLIWMIANPKMWEGTALENKVLKPDDNMIFPYQAHAFYYVKEGEYVLFDNHWHKRRPVKFFDKKKESFVQVFQVDEDAFTVKLKHSHIVPKTKIRSNGVIREETGVGYAMAGNLEPAMKGNLGMVEQYDLESNQCQARFFVKNGFFRGYPFELLLEDIKPEINGKGPYIKGEIEPTKRSEHNHNYQEMPQEAEVSMVLRGKVLYIRALDHAIERVYFAGEDGTSYKKCFGQTKQTMPHLFGEYNYYLPISLQGMVHGKYKIQLKYKGNYYKTDYYFTI